MDEISGYIAEPENRPLVKIIFKDVGEQETVLLRLCETREMVDYFQTLTNEMNRQHFETGGTGGYRLIIK